MLTDIEKREIDAELKQYERKESAGLEALKVVQEHRGWISDEALEAVAAYLDLTPEELDSVATFYSLLFRKPVGEHVILICDSVTCWIMGYEQLRERLKEQLGIDLGQTTTDKQFTLLPIPCLGTCDRAPALMIDNDLHRDLDPEKIDDLLARYCQDQTNGKG